MYLQARKGLTKLNWSVLFSGPGYAEKRNPIGTFTSRVVAFFFTKVRRV